MFNPFLTQILSDGRLSNRCNFSAKSVIELWENTKKIDTLNIETCCIYQYLFYVLTLIYFISCMVPLFVVCSWRISALLDVPVNVCIAFELFKRSCEH